jgi:hypothetical protein
MCNSEDELKGLLTSDIGGWAAWSAPDAEFEKVLWVGYYLVWVSQSLHSLSKSRLGTRLIEL